jgi:hypothetical protein
MLRISRPIRRPDVQTELLPDGTCLLFDPASGLGHVLNTSAALVWDYCDGAMTAEAIAAELAALLPEFPDAASETLHVIDELRQLGLLRLAAAVTAHP